MKFTLACIMATSAMAIRLSQEELSASDVISLIDDNGDAQISNEDGCEAIDGLVKDGKISEGEAKDAKKDLKDATQGESVSVDEIVDAASGDADVVAEVEEAVTLAQEDDFDGLTEEEIAELMDKDGEKEFKELPEDEQKEIIDALELAQEDDELSPSEVFDLIKDNGDAKIDEDAACEAIDGLVKDGKISEGDAKDAKMALKDATKGEHFSVDDLVAAVADDDEVVAEVEEALTLAQEDDEETLSDEEFFALFDANSNGEICDAEAFAVIDDLLADEFISKDVAKEMKQEWRDATKGEPVTFDELVAAVEDEDEA